MNEKIANEVNLIASANLMILKYCTKPGAIEEGEKFELTQAVLELHRNLILLERRLRTTDSAWPEEMESGKATAGLAMEEILAGADW